jgi:hypothetical protein
MYVGLKTIIPISASESIPISVIYKSIFTLVGFEPPPLKIQSEHYTTQLWYFFIGWEDVRYRIKLYSDIRYTPLSQSAIGDSVIRLSQILLITDIGLSAYLWFPSGFNVPWVRFEPSQNFLHFWWEQQVCWGLIRWCCGGVEGLEIWAMFFKSPVQDWRRRELVRCSNVETGVLPPW